MHTIYARKSFYYYNCMYVQYNIVCVYVCVKRTDEIIYTVCIKNTLYTMLVIVMCLCLRQKVIPTFPDYIQAMHARLKLYSKEYNSSALVVWWPNFIEPSILYYK